MIGPGTAEARLREAGWLRDAALQDIFLLLEGERGATRAVGGLVRDTILDLPRAGTDIDLATVLVPDKVVARARAAGVGVHPTGLAHGTVTLVHGGRSVEVTTLREDVETDGRHAVVRFGTDWAADAGRRDFTLNALYADMDGTLFDPLGGLSDCIEGRVRFIGDARRRIAEDGLRVYRFFRFSASHGGERLDPEGLEAVAEAVGRLDHLSAERVGAEMRRMLALRRVGGVLEAMAGIGLVPFSAAVLEGLRRYERQAADPGFSGRLALLLEEADGQALKARWRLSNAELGAALALREAAGLIEALRFHEAVYRHPGRLGEALDVAAARARWSGAGKAAMRDRLLAVDPRPFPVTGADLLGLGLRPGPALGATLARLERDWIESGFALDRAALLARAGEESGS